MNYIPLTIDKLKDLMKEYPEYSFGELLHSFLREGILKGKPDGKSTTWLMDIEDKDFYTAIDRAISAEKE